MSDLLKHTPGPWEVSVCSIWDVEVVANGGTVCQINNKGDWFPTGDGVQSGRSGNRIAADARLIAAAPELLEAAKEAREALQPFLTEEPAAEWTAARMLDAAIAKATGEA